MPEFISALIDITNSMYALSIIPADTADSIRLRLDNCYKVREYDKMLKCSCTISKKDLEKDADQAIAWCMVELMRQLEKKEKELNDQA